MNKHRVLSWLKKRRDLRVVSQAYVFGSIVADRKQNDVDIIVVVGRKIIVVVGRKIVRRELSVLRRGFRAVFDKRLHIQLFHDKQLPQILDFLRRCGPRIRWR